MSPTSLIKYSKRFTSLLCGLALLMFLAVGSVQVNAAPAGGKNCDPVTDATCARCATNADGTVPAGCPKCNGTICDSAASPKTSCTNNHCDFIDHYINPAINLLSALFALVAVISLVAAGIQYSSSGGDPQKVALAKSRISKTLVALVAYLFLYSFLQFIIPGGIFR